MGAIWLRIYENRYMKMNHNIITSHYQYIHHHKRLTTVNIIPTRVRKFDGWQFFILIVPSTNETYTLINVFHSRSQKYILPSSLTPKLK